MLPMSTYAIFVEMHHDNIVMEMLNNSVYFLLMNTTHMYCCFCNNENTESCLEKGEHTLHCIPLCLHFHFVSFFREG